MKKQFQLLMYTGIMAGIAMSSCKTTDNVVVNDSDAPHKRVYHTTEGSTTNNKTRRGYTRSVQPNASVHSISNTDVVTSELPPVCEDQVAQSYPSDNTPSAQYVPQLVDMSVQSDPQMGHYNQSVQSNRPVSQSYGGYNSVKVHNTRKADNTYQLTNERNKDLDNSLSNRPTANTLSEDMYTSEYRTKAGRGQKRAYNAQSANNNSYEGLMTLEDGNVVPYNANARVATKQQQSYVQDESQQAEIKQCVVPAQAQQESTSDHNYVYSENEVRQADGSYSATLYFKNGAKLTGTLVKIDNSACMFRMAEGRLVNFATKDILKIVRR